MKNIYNIEAGDVMWAASDVGWVVGHSYIVYAPLFAGATTVIYEGKPIGTPDAGAFWRVVQEHKVKVLFTAPTAIRAIRRTDDVINVAGHRLSTGQLEEALAHHPAVAECAVIGVKDDLKGQRAAGFVTLKAGVTEDHKQICDELVKLVRDKVGPVAAFRDVAVLARLPKTRSGKILRKTMRQIVDGEPVKVPPTIEDPTVLDDLRAVFGL